MIAPISASSSANKHKSSVGKTTLGGKVSCGGRRPQSKRSCSAHYSDPLSMGSSNSKSPDSFQIEEEFGSAFDQDFQTKTRLFSGQSQHLISKILATSGVDNADGLSENVIKDLKSFKKEFRSLWKQFQATSINNQEIDESDVFNLIAGLHSFGELSGLSQEVVYQRTFDILSYARRRQFFLGKKYSSSLQEFLPDDFFRSAVLWAVEKGYLNTLGTIFSTWSHLRIFTSSNTIRLTLKVVFDHYIESDNYQSLARLSTIILLQNTQPEITYLSYANKKDQAIDRLPASDSQLVDYVLFQITLKMIEFHEQPQNDHKLWKLYGAVTSAHLTIQFEPESVVLSVIDDGEEADNENEDRLYGESGKDLSSPSFIPVWVLHTIEGRRRIFSTLVEGLILSADFSGELPQFFFEKGQLDRLVESVKLFQLQRAFRRNFKNK